MTTSYTFAETFTRAHARRLAGRVTTDLHQCRRIYGGPSESRLAEYQAELEELLAGGYVEAYQFGYKRDGKLVWSLRYAVGPDGGLVADTRAGGVPMGVDINGAVFFNFLTFSDSWSRLSRTEREGIEAKLPFTRSFGLLPSEANGYWSRDRAYTAGGVLIEREVFKRIA